MTPAQLARAAAQQAKAIASMKAEAGRVEAHRPDALAAVGARHTDLPYIRAAATARATRVGPGPDRPRVHQQ